MILTSKHNKTIILLLFSTLSIAEGDPLSIKEFTNKTLKNIPTNSADFASKYMNPLLGNEQITTPNGTKFGVNVSCPTSNAFLQVFAQAGIKGDLSLLQFSRDKNLDGTIDQVQNFPKPVSGVCANGLISCDVGTWNNCSGYKWSAQNDNLSLAQTGISDLGGCYCINGSCGDTRKSSRIISSIVTDLGSSAANTLAKHNPQYQISGTQTQGPVARFYGQKLEGCGKGSPAELRNYYSNPSAIETQANSYKTDPKGIYMLMANSPISQNSIQTTSYCSIKRNTSYKSLCRCSNGEPPQACGSACPVVYKNVAGAWGPSITVKGDKPNVTDTCNGSWSNPFSGPYTTPCVDVDETDHWYGGWLGTGSRRSVYSVRNITKIIDQSADKFATNIDSKFCELDKEWLSNSCEVYKNDDRCKLKNENIDGVSTYFNYHPSGKLPIATTKNIAGGSCDVIITRDYWQVSKEYQCKTNVAIDFDEAIKRKSHVENSLSADMYQDLVAGVSTQRSLNVPTIAPPTNCSNACKTKRIKEKSSVSKAGPITDVVGNQHETLYRKCTGPSNNICPLGASEILVTACSCLNEFGAASTMMQSLRQAAQSLICTTGNPKSY